MHAVGANALRKFRIGRDQQYQAARAANTAQPPRHTRTIDRTKMPIHHGCPTRQALRDFHRIGRAGGVGEEKQRRNGWRARLAVEPARKRG